MNASTLIDDRREQASYTMIAFNAPVLLLLQLAAFWHVWRWLSVRFSTSSDAIWEALPLLCVVLFCVYSGTSVRLVSPAGLLAASACLIAYSALFTAAPFTVRAILALASMTFILSSWRFGRTFHFGIFALLLLSLPLTDSLNFFLGYPMRVVVGEAVAFMLGLQGLDVYRVGVSLHFGEKLIWIDAPCSGIKMLWFGMFLSIFMSCLFALRTVRLLIVLCLSFVAILLGNILRASALFYLEAGLIDAAPWMHSAVGVVAFAITSITIVLIARKIWLLNRRP